MYDHYFSYLGRPPIPDNLCKDSDTRHPRFWRRFLKVFTILWAWRPSWSMDGNHFSNLSFPCPREASNEIWATSAQRLKRRSRLKFWTFFPYKYTGKQTWPRRKKVKCQCTTIILTTLVDLPSPMIYRILEKKLLPYMGMAAILVNGRQPF